MTEEKNNSFEDLLKKVISLLESSLFEEAAETIKSLHSSDIAKLIESLTPKERSLIWPRIEHNIYGEILKEVDSEAKIQLIEEMSVDSLVKATKNLDMDDLADIVPILSDNAVHSILLALDQKHREHLKKILSYPKECAGAIMNNDFITVRADVTVGVVIRYLRLLKEMPTDTDKIFVVDRNFKYIGFLHVSMILTQSPNKEILPLINKDNLKPFLANMDKNEVANLFEQRNLISAPVVDESNQIVGRITIDDIVDVIRGEAEHSLMSMAGLDEDEDVFAPTVQSVKRRSIWLGINLITAFIVVYFIGLFEATIEQKIALAILMPVVASMGGIAGMQTLILVTRGIATKKINMSNIKSLLNKEVSIGILNGFLWALLIAVITFYWFGDLLISFIISLAIIFNLIIAAFSGACLPLFLKKMKIDPALAGGVILTTITDVMGFVIFLGLATIFI